MLEKIFEEFLIKLGATREEAKNSIQNLIKIYSIVEDEEIRQDEIGMLVSRIKGKLNEKIN